MTDTETPFARLAGVLNALGLPALLLPVEAENPVEMLLVSVDEPPLAPDQESRFVFQLFFAGDMLNQALHEGGAAAPDEADSVILQFILSLPVEQPPVDLLSLYQLLSVLNRILPVGSFELNEAQQVYLRYGLLAESKAGLTLPQVVEVLDLLRFFVLRMSPGIEALIRGEKTLEVVLPEIEQRLLESAQLAPSAG